MFYYILKDRKTPVGTHHGRPPTQNPCRLSEMSQRHSRRTGRWTPQIGMRTLESAVHGNMQAAFAGGPGEKGCNRSTSPAAYPTGLLDSVGVTLWRRKSNKKSRPSCESVFILLSTKRRRTLPTHEPKKPSSWGLSSKWETTAQRKSPSQPADLEGDLNDARRDGKLS